MYILVVLLEVAETSTEELIASSVSLVLYLGLLGTSVRRAGGLGKCEIGGENRSCSGKKKCNSLSAARKMKWRK